MPTDDGYIDADIGKRTPPPGYRIVYSEITEHYQWLHEASDTESVIVSDKWDAYHGAWSHYQKQREGHHAD